MNCPEGLGGLCYPCGNSGGVGSHQFPAKMGNPGWWWLGGGGGSPKWYSLRGGGMDIFWNYTFFIQLFRESLSQKLCTRQSRTVVWDMINTLVPDTVAVEPILLLLSFSTRKQMSMASRTIPWNSFENQWSENHPQYLSGLSHALFPTTFLETAVYNSALLSGQPKL